MSKNIKLGLLGNNLGRSRAKNLIELLGELNGLHVTYQPMDLANAEKPVSIAVELEKCRKKGFRGVNVTHPYKRDAFKYVKTMEGFPPGLTSVNTVLFNDGELLADNTDYSGCCCAFRTKFGEDFKPGKVLMLGAGGVGVAIAHAMSNLGAEELIIHDIIQESALNLIDQVSASKMSARLAGVDLLSEMANADGLINATPIGMFQYPGNPFPEEGIASQRWAFDAVYTPENTQFLHACRQKKIETLSGFYLFLYQGLHAFDRFIGIAENADKIEPIFLKRFPLE